MRRGMYRYLILLVVSAAITTGARASLEAGGARVDTATLTNIVSRVDGRAGVISIEASDPVAYIASQPDPRVFIIELRDVDALGFTDHFTQDSRHPFVAVEVEAGQAPDGARVARVRIQLAQPMRPRVRSARNIIYVEADRLDRAVRSPGTIIAAGASSAIHDVRVARRGPATAVTLYATGPLSASSVVASTDGPPRLMIDVPNATSALPGTMPVGAGPVEAVRIGLSPESPLLTRVSMDLTRDAPFRLETSDDGHNLTVIFDEPSLPGSVPSASAGLVAPRQAPVMQQAAASQQAQSPQTQAPQQATEPTPEPAASATAPEPDIAPLRFTGFPVSLDFQGADLRAVLRTFSEISSLNVVIDPTIQGTVDVALRDVPWDQALDIILRSNGLGYAIEGTIVRIVPLTVLVTEEQARRTLAEQQALAGELLTITRTLSYARAEDLEPLLTETALSQRGSVSTDIRTNTLIITDLSERLTRATELIATLDQPESQVEIEARIIRTTRQFAHELGVQWGFSGRAASDLGNTLPVAFPNQAAVGGRTGTNQGPEGGFGADAVGTAVNLGVGSATSAVGLALGSVNGAFNLDMAISALESQGQLRVLSTPRVSTQNNTTAEIGQGAEIPIQTIANNTVTVTYIDAKLVLRVTPQITSAQTVIMDIVVENNSPNFGRVINGNPQIDTQSATTKVLVSDGETTVIGGVYVSSASSTQDRTPGLSKIPLLGWLFKRDTAVDSDEELLIFITPRIIKLGETRQ
jgi:type IV pilus secretin PilQ/predicted competence protein